MPPGASKQQLLCTADEFSQLNGRSDGQDCRSELVQVPVAARRAARLARIVGIERLNMMLNSGVYTRTSILRRRLFIYILHRHRYLVCSGRGEAAVYVRSNNHLLADTAGVVCPSPPPMTSHHHDFPIRPWRNAPFALGGTSQVTSTRTPRVYRSALRLSPIGLLLSLIRDPIDQVGSSSG